MPLRLSEFAQRLGARALGSPQDVELGALAAPAVARCHDLTFALAGSSRCTSQAAAVITCDATAGFIPALLVDDVLIACGRAAAWLPIRRNAAAMLERSRCIATNAVIADDAQVGAAVRIGEQTVIEAGVVLDPGVTIGAFCRIGAGAVIKGQTHIGNRVSIGAGSVIGDDGFGFVRDGASWLRVPNFGSVRVGDDVVILAQVVVHAGVFSDTQIANGCVLDSQVLIGHDSRIGANTAIAGQTAVAGAAIIGRNCLIGGKVGIGEGVVLADRVTVTGMSMVTRSIETAGCRYSSGWPAEPSATWWRRVGKFRRALQGRPTDDDLRLTES